MSDSIQFATMAPAEREWTLRTAASADEIDAMMRDGRAGAFFTMKDRYHVFLGSGADITYTAVAVVDRDGDFEDIQQTDIRSFEAIFSGE